MSIGKTARPPGLDVEVDGTSPKQKGGIALCESTTFMTSRRLLAVLEDHDERAVDPSKR